MFIILFFLKIIIFGIFTQHYVEFLLLRNHNNIPRLIKFQEKKSFRKIMFVLPLNEIIYLLWCKTLNADLRVSLQFSKSLQKSLKCSPEWCICGILVKSAGMKQILRARNVGLIYWDPPHEISRKNLQQKIGRIISELRLKLNHLISCPSCSRSREQVNFPFIIFTHPYSLDTNIQYGDKDRGGCQIFPK